MKVQLLAERDWTAVVECSLSGVCVFSVLMTSFIFGPAQKYCWCTSIKYIIN